MCVWNKNDIVHSMELQSIIMHNSSEKKNFEQGNKIFVFHTP